MNAFSLVIDLGEEGLKRFDLSEEKVSIGRAPTNDVQVLVRQMSVHHAEIVFLGKTYGVIDKGSTNGTEVNDIPVGAAGIELSSMDRIVFGHEVHAFYIPSAVLDNSPIDDVVADIRSAAAAPPSITTATVGTQATPNTVRLGSIRPARASQASGPLVAAAPPTGGIPMALPSASGPIRPNAPAQAPQPVPLRPPSAGPAPVGPPPAAGNTSPAPQAAPLKPQPLAPPPLSEADRSLPPVAAPSKPPGAPAGAPAAARPNLATPGGGAKKPKLATPAPAKPPKTLATPD